MRYERIMINENKAIKHLSLPKGDRLEFSMSSSSYDFSKNFFPLGYGRQKN